MSKPLKGISQGCIDCHTSRSNAVTIYLFSERIRRRGRRRAWRRFQGPDRGREVLPEPVRLQERSGHRHLRCQRANAAGNRTLYPCYSLQPFEGHRTISRKGLDTIFIRYIGPLVLPCTPVSFPPCGVLCWRVRWVEAPFPLSGGAKP